MRTRLYQGLTGFFLTLIFTTILYAGTEYDGSGMAHYWVGVKDLISDCDCNLDVDVYLKSDGTYQATLTPEKRFWVNRTPGETEFEAIEVVCETSQLPVPFTVWGDYYDGRLQTVTDDNIGDDEWTIESVGGEITESNIKNFHLTLEKTIEHAPPSFGTETQRKMYSANTLTNPNAPAPHIVEFYCIVQDWEENRLPGVLFQCNGITNAIFQETETTGSEIGFLHFYISPREQSGGVTGNFVTLIHEPTDDYNAYYKQYDVDDSGSPPLYIVTLLPKDVTLFALMVDIIGDVEVNAPGSGSWTAATEGMPLDDGTRIRTGDGIAYVILPGNEGGFSLRPSSEATISIGNHTTGETIINFLKGEMGINKHVNGAGIQITMPGGAAGDHGTKFNIRVTNDNSYIEIAEGSVWTCPNGSGTTNLHYAGKKVTITAAGQVLETTMSAAERDALQSSFTTLDFLVSGYTTDQKDYTFSSNADGWLDDGSGCWSVSGGRYVMTGNKGNLLRFSRCNLPGCSDYSIEADVRKTQGDSDSYTYGYGLYARCSPTLLYNYEFNILEDGRYMIAKTVNGSFTTLVDYTASAALNTGLNTWNTLRIDVSDNTLSFYANDTWLTSICDDSIADGYPALFAVDAAASTLPDTVQFDNVSITYQGRGSSAGSYVKNDFDTDGKSDLVVYNIQTGDWYIRQSSDGEMYNGGPVQWGWGGALPVSGDFDADGLSDIAVYNLQTGDWYIQQSSNGQLYNNGAYQFGWAGALPAAGDFDNDGISDIAVYNLQTGEWYIRQSSNGQLYGGGAYQFGWSGALPAPGDFDNDGISDIAVYNLQTGDWYILQSSNGQLYNGGAYQFGWSGALPCQGDYDGDGITDIAVYNLQTGDWYILQSSNGQLYSGGAIQFGWSGAIPTYGN